MNMLKMTKAEEKGIFKAAVVVKDELGLPNFMTMFYMEPGTFKEEDVPGMFKIKGKTVPAILISQYFNTMLRGVPVSLRSALYLEDRELVTELLKASAAAHA